MKKSIFILIALGLVCSGYALIIHRTPPFSTLTLSGKTKTIYDRVSLFESGASRQPFKTAEVSFPDGGYSLSVHIPDNLKKQAHYLYTDMRFWRDSNKNGRRDPGEPYSKCHFITWNLLSTKSLSMSIKGRLSRLSLPPSPLTICNVCQISIIKLRQQSGRRRQF